MSGAASSRPLAGITVVELAGIGPAPLACTMLAEMGCDVIRIERVTRSDNSIDSRLAGIAVRPRTTIAVDLKSDDGREVVRSLIDSADVLIEGFRPGTAERLGIGPDSFKDTNPGLVYMRLTGWGQDGPYAMMAGHDINYIGLSGALAAIGEESKPIPPLNLVGDYAGGTMFAVVGVLAALVERARTGRGATIDTAMIDGVSTLMSPIRDVAELDAWVEERSSNLLDGGAPFYRTYGTSDGGFMAVGALEPVFYSEFVAGLGLDEADLPNRFDPDNWDELAELFGGCFAENTRDHWQRIFDGTDACVTPVLTMSESEGHPQNASRHHGFTSQPLDSGAAQLVLSNAGWADELINVMIDSGVIEIR